MQRVDMLYPMDTDITPLENSNTKRIYSRNQLLEIRTKTTPERTHVPGVPEEIRRPYRGCRAGAKVKARLLAKRWKYKPTVPSCVMGNVNSLPNKMDELASLVRTEKLYRECSVMFSRRRGSTRTLQTASSSSRVSRSYGRTETRSRVGRTKVADSYCTSTTDGVTPDTLQ